MTTREREYIVSSYQDAARTVAELAAMVQVLEAVGSPSHAEELEQLQGLRLDLARMRLIIEALGIDPLAT